MEKILLCLLLLAVPAPSADLWTLPLFASASGQAYDAAQKFAAPPSADLYVIDQTIVVRIDAEGRISKTSRVIFRVLTEAGAKRFAQIAEPWLAWRQQKPTLMARVITADKQGHLLDPATITEAGLPGANNMYSDVKILQAPLPAIAANSVLEYQIETADREALISAGRFDRYPVAVPYPVHHFTLQVQAARNLRAMARGFEKIDRREWSQDGESIVRFEAWEIKPYEPLTMLPPELPNGPEIVISTAASWQSVAHWYQTATESILAPQDTPSAPPIESDRAASIGAILAAIQKKVRFTGLELGVAAYLPRTPAETLARGYGDCKDKAALLVSRLRAAGIPAKLALLTPNPFSDVIPEAPGLEAFNHVIVYVPGQPPLWIDPSSQYTPATRLPDADQGRNALIVDGASTALVRTPESTAADNGTTIEMTITLQPQGKAILSEVETYTGNTQEITRPLFAQFDTPDLKAKLGDQFRNLFRAEKITRLDYGDPAAVDQPFRILSSAEGSESGNTQGDMARFSMKFDLNLLAGFSNFIAKPAKPDGKPSRTEDYYIGGPHRSESRRVVIPPPGFILKHAPEFSAVELGPLKLERTISVRPDKAVLVTSALTCPRRRYSAAEGAEIAAGLAKLTSEQNLNFDFTDQVQQFLTDGKEKEAVALAEARTKADPSNVPNLLRLASTLSAIGANSLAIETCRRATVLDPKSSAAFSALADLYSRDEAGRTLHRGMQYAQAIAALQHAIELDPKNAGLSLKLSSWYEFDASGLRFSNGAHMSEAIATLRKIEADLPGLNAINALPTALLFSRQYPEVKRFYEKDTNHAAWSYRLAAIAATDGLEAVKSAFDSSQTSESRQSVFTQAGHYLLALREYAAAAGLLRAATQDQSASEQVDFEMLARTRRREEAHFSSEAPIALTQQVIYALLDPDDSESWSKLYAPEWRGLKLQQERDELLRMLRAWHLVAKQQLGWTAIADVATSNAAFVSEGSDRSGYRVRLADPASNGAMKTIAWVVKRDAGYQVVGLGGDRPAAGGEALKAAQSGDLKAARQWLEWVREELVLPSGTDPLTGLAAARLWPAAHAGAKETMVAAANLAARGLNYETAVTVLLNAQKEADSGPFRDAIDMALAQSYEIHQQFNLGVPEATRLYENYPESDAAFRLLSSMLVNSGQFSAAEKLVKQRLSRDANSAAAMRTQSDVLAVQQHYGAAVASIRTVTRTAKVTAADWNQLAWLTLFTDEVGPAALEAANNAIRLTQSRNPSELHTLACVQAELGNTAAARKLLYQYLDTAESFNDPAWLLLGLIIEKVGLPDAARENYLKLAPPKLREATSAYALAQLRLSVM